MDPSTNTGSFAAILGGADPLKQALARRGGGLNNLTPSAPGFDPNAVPPTPATGAVPMPAGLTAGPGAAGPTPPTTGSAPPGAATEPDSTLIIKALGDALRNMTKNPTA